MPTQIIGRARNGFSQTLRKDACFFWILQFGLNDRKFVATQTRYKICLAKAAAQTLCDLLQ